MRVVIVLLNKAPHKFAQHRPPRGADRMRSTGRPLQPPDCKGLHHSCIPRCVGAAL